MRGDLQVFKNTGGVTVMGNTVGGNLQCGENTPPAVAAGNVAGGNREGECPA